MDQKRRKTEFRENEVKESACRMLLYGRSFVHRSNFGATGLQPSLLTAAQASSSSTSSTEAALPDWWDEGVEDRDCSELEPSAEALSEVDLFFFFAHNTHVFCSISRI